MADRVSASILIGGALSAAAYAELAELVAAEGLAVEWDGETFAPDHRTIGEPLRLFAREVAWGMFDDLERWCLDQRLPFARWSGGYDGEWSSQRLVSDSEGVQRTFSVTEDDEVVITEAEIEQLGSLDAIRAHFASAGLVVPPLVVAGDAAPDSSSTPTISGGSLVE